VLINLSVNVTYRCNTVCAHCNRGVGTIDWSDMPDMTPPDAERVVAAVRRAGHIVEKVKLSGGEPTINRDLAGICRAFLSICDRVWVVTNGLVRPPPKLPPGAIYKLEHVSTKEHFPFFVSPADIGKGAFVRRYNRCIIPSISGRGVTPDGKFLQCSQSLVITRALGWDDSVAVRSEPVTKLDHNICQHCPHSLGTFSYKRLTWRVLRGETECPTRSFVNVKKDYRIIYQADAHIKRAVDRGECDVDPMTGLVVDRDNRGRELHQVAL
jgi:hypothetical protein